MSHAIHLSRIGPTNGPYDVQALLPGYDDDLESTIVAFTGYRLLVTALLVVLGVCKAALQYDGQSLAPNTLDLVLCLAGIFLIYWVGPLETVRPLVMPWFLHRDVVTATRRWLRRKVKQPSGSGINSQDEDEIGTTFRFPAVTPHRLVSSALLTAFGATKAALGYTGQITAGTTLDWTGGVLLTLILYWIGLHEWVRPAVAPWYFHQDVLRKERKVENMDPRDHVDNQRNISYDENPRFAVKITGYRLLNTIVIISFGLAKASMSYMGRTMLPITLEWVMGVLAAIILYWIGFFEAPKTRTMTWFYQQDYSSNLSVPLPGGNMIFPIIVISIILAAHLFVNIKIASGLLTCLPTDNKVDKVCRILEIINLALFSVLIFVSLVRFLRDRYGDGAASLLTIPGAYFLYFVFVGVLSSVKGAKGYRDPATIPPDAGDGKHHESGWCIEVLFWAWCW